MHLHLLPVGSRAAYSPRCVLTNEETITRASNIFLPCRGIFDWLDKGRKYKHSKLTKVQTDKACLCIQKALILGKPRLMVSNYSIRTSAS